MAGSETWVKLSPLSDLLPCGSLVHPNLACPGHSLSGASGENCECGFSACFLGPGQEELGSSYRLILASLNPVAGDEAGFPSRVDHQQKPIEAPEEYKGHLGDT